MNGIATDEILELSQIEKERIFNLGYYTWVEQQGIDLDNFEARKDKEYWDAHYKHMLSLDEKIDTFNSL